MEPCSSGVKPILLISRSSLYYGSASNFLRAWVPSLVACHQPAQTTGLSLPELLSSAIHLVPASGIQLLIAVLVSSCLSILICLCLPKFHCVKMQSRLWKDVLQMRLNCCTIPKITNGRRESHCYISSEVCLPASIIVNFCFRHKKALQTEKPCQ
jgi:hypothetical protein